MSDINTDRKVKMLSTFILDLSIENIVPMYSQDPKDKLTLTFSELAVLHKERQKELFDLSIDLKVVGSINNNNAFIIDIKQNGIFEVKYSDNEELLKLLYVDCAHMLIPYIRQQIHYFSVNIGAPSVFIPYIDFEQQYASKNFKKYN